VLTAGWGKNLAVESWISADVVVGSSKESTGDRAVDGDEGGVRISRLLPPGDLIRRLDIICHIVVDWRRPYFYYKTVCYELAPASRQIVVGEWRQNSRRDLFAYVFDQALNCSRISVLGQLARHLHYVRRDAGVSSAT
jgi:hypothetical protein